MDFIKDKMISNRQIREEIEHVTEKSFFSSRNRHTQDTIGDLLYRMAEAMMRYPMILGEIVKEARKLDYTRIEKEAQKAQDMMKNMMYHVDRCTNDHRNIEIVRKLYEMNEMKCGECALREQGLLLFELNDIDLHMKHREETFRQFKLFVFEELLVAFELKERPILLKNKDGSYQFDWYSNKPITKGIAREYHFSRSYKISNFGEINPIENKNILELNTYKKGTTNEDRKRSLEIKFSSIETRNDFEYKIKERQFEIEKFFHANPGSKHSNHKFKTFQNNYLNEVSRSIIRVDLFYTYICVFRLMNAYT